MPKLLALVSGGIDSAAAAALALEQGLEIAAAHFERAPFSDSAVEDKAKRIAAFLSEKFNAPIRLHVIPHGKYLTQIARNCEMRYVCVMCRRMMLRIASEIAIAEKCDALLTGESLGQVASQTLHNLSAEHGASSIPVARPFLCMDKLEIERVGKRFGTYELSILPGGCCEMVPPKPATRATIEKILAEEKKIDIAAIAADARAMEKICEFGFGKSKGQTAE